MSRAKYDEVEANTTQACDGYILEKSVVFVAGDSKKNWMETLWFRTQENILKVESRENIFLFVLSYYSQSALKVAKKAKKTFWKTATKTLNGTENWPKKRQRMGWYKKGLSMYNERK